MKTNPRPKHSATLRRLILWAGLFLAWIVPFAAGAAHTFRATRWLEASLAHTARRMAALVGNILLLEATLHVAMRRGRLSDNLAGRQRALVGAALRRFLRAGTPLQCLQRLALVLRHRAEIVTYVVARIERGLTRTHSAPARTRPPTLPFVTFSLVAADSS
jgi:urea transporter